MSFDKFLRKQRTTKSPTTYGTIVPCTDTKQEEAARQQAALIAPYWNKDKVPLVILGLMTGVKRYTNNIVDFSNHFTPQAKLLRAPKGEVGSVFAPFHANMDGKAPWRFIRTNDALDDYPVTFTALTPDTTVTVLHITETAHSAWMDMLNNLRFLKTPLGPNEQPVSWLTTRISAVLDAQEPQYVSKYVLRTPGDQLTMRVCVPFQIAAGGVVQCTMHIGKEIALPADGMIDFTACTWHNMYGKTLAFTKPTGPLEPVFGHLGVAAPLGAAPTKCATVAVPPADVTTKEVATKEAAPKGTTAIAPHTPIILPSPPSGGPLPVTEVTARIQQVLERVDGAIECALTQQLRRECALILTSLRDAPYNSTGAYDLSAVERLYGQLEQQETVRRRLVSSSSDALVLMPPATRGACTACKKETRLHVNNTCKQCFNAHVTERAKAIMDKQWEGWRELDANDHESLQKNIKTALEQLESSDLETLRKGYSMLRACERVVGVAAEGPPPKVTAPVGAGVAAKKRKSTRAVKPVERFNLSERPEDDIDEGDEVDLGREPMQHSDEDGDEEEEDDDDDEVDSWIAPSNEDEDDEDDDNDENDPEASELKKLRLADNILKTHKRLRVESVFDELEDNYLCGDKDSLALVEAQLKKLAKVEQVWCIQVTRPGCDPCDYPTYYLSEAAAMQRVSSMMLDSGAAEKSGIKYKIYQKGLSN